DRRANTRSTTAASGAPAHVLPAPRRSSVAPRVIRARRGVAPQPDPTRRPTAGAIDFRMAGGPERTRARFRSGHLRAPPGTGRPTRGAPRFLAGRVGARSYPDR